MAEEPTLDTILESRSLTRDDLDHKCSDERHMNKLALKIHTWKAVAAFIGLSKQDEENIKADNRTNADRKIAMLRRWSERYGDGATYLKLAETFEALKRRDLIVMLIEFACDHEAERDSATTAAPRPRNASSSQLQLVSRGNPQAILNLTAQNQEQQKDRDFHGVPAFGERDEEIDSAGENDELEDQLDGMIVNEQPLVQNEDPQNEQQHNGEQDNEKPEANPGEPEIPRFKETGQLASTIKSIEHIDSELMSRLRMEIKLILHTCNDNEQRAVLKTLSPLSLKGFENQSFVVWDPQGHAHIGKFAEQVVAVLFTDQAENARGGLQHALKNYEKAQAIIGVGIGYGKDRKSFRFADVMVSKHIENAASIKIEHSEDIPMKVYQRGARQPVNMELLSHFRNHKLMWEGTFKVTQSEEEQTGRSSQVHIGTIVSGPILLKSKPLKEELMALMDKTVGGEMEGWVLLGMIEEMRRMKRQISVIVVKGVADYGDIGKDDGWQLTAAMAAIDFVRHCIEISGPAANYCPAP